MEFIFKNENNMIYAFDDDCFDEKGQVINEWAIQKIKEHSLVQITDEEAEATINYKSPEQIAEEERLNKLPSQEDILNARIELKSLELLSQLELI